MKEWAMPKCRFCNHDNPVGIDRCQSCGAWIEQAVPATATSQGQENGPAPDESRPDPGSLEGQVLALVQSQKKIEAIKLYRQQTGTGLKEAKDAVEALAAKHGISSQGAGCAGMVLLVLVAAAGIGTWAMLS
jgi:ribosomal protein L7/L12